MARFNHKRVVVGVIYDPERGFLLPYNERWHHFAFVMKRIGEDQPTAHTAIDALKQDIHLRFPDAKARAVDRVGVYGMSEHTGQEAYYDYTVYLYDLGPSQGGAASAKDARFYSYQQLIDDKDDVSWNTKEIARALVEQREVVAAVVARRGPHGPECLLVSSRDRQYFVPSTRRKTDLPPEAVAAEAIRQDTGYEGPVEATWIGEQEFFQASQRFGHHKTRFRFHVCRVRLPDADLFDPAAPLSVALRQKEQEAREAGAQIPAQGYCQWCPIDQLGSVVDASPTLGQLAALIRNAAE